jgi:hypothetical protein
VATLIAIPVTGGAWFGLVSACLGWFGSVWVGFGWFGLVWGWFGLVLGWLGPKLPQISRVDGNNPQG